MDVKNNMIPDQGDVKITGKTINCSSKKKKKQNNQTVIITVPQTQACMRRTQSLVVNMMEESLADRLPVARTLAIARTVRGNWSPIK